MMRIPPECSGERGEAMPFMIGLINIVASVALGYLAVWFGVLLATRH